MPTPTEIKEARKNAGLTIAKAAELVHVSLNTWQKWEGGRIKMNPTAWELFCIKTGRDVMIEPKFKRHLNEGTKELLDLLVYNGEWWQVGEPDENRICEAWRYGEPEKTMTLKEVWRGVGEPIDGEYDQYELVGYEIQ